MSAFPRTLLTAFREGKRREKVCGEREKREGKREGRKGNMRVSKGRTRHQIPKQIDAYVCVY